MASRTVYRCRQDMVCMVNGERRHFAEGDLVFEGHAVKPKGNPHFEEISEYVERTSTPYRRGVPVEDATADPGRPRFLGGLLGSKDDSGAGTPGDPSATSDPGDAGNADDDNVPARPPTSGTGSSVEAWREYAAKVTDSPAESWANLSRAEIIELLDSEGADNGQA